MRESRARRPPLAEVFIGMSLRHLMRVVMPGKQGARNLTHDEAYRAFDEILGGRYSEVAVASFLIALRMKGLTVEELLGFARAARAHATLPGAEIEGLLCVSPSQEGWERGPALEVAAGLVAAGSGARVLVSADRCVPPKRGLSAASVLEHLGAGMTWDPREAESWLVEAGFAACAVSGMLPELMGLRRVRGDVGVRTPLSTVEKLVAPPHAAVLLGAQEGPVLGIAAEVMQSLGHPRGIVLQGPEGGVVPSVRKRTRGIELAERAIVPFAVEPEDYGLRCDIEPDMPMFGPPPEEHGAGDNPELVRFVGELTLAVLDGRERGPARAATLLASATMLKAAGRVLTMAEGVDAATRALDSGAALQVIARLRKLVA